MHPVLKWGGAIAAVTTTLAVTVPVSLYVASEAVIERRYPLPAIEEPAAPSPKTLERGFHLGQIAGCSNCHGVDFKGRLTKDAQPLRVWSSNLRLSAARMSDGEFERALRRGIAADATSLWAMPSDDYAYMSEADVAALLTYLRSLGPAGRTRPRPVWDRDARLALLEGRIVPAVLAVRDAPSSLDLGPRYDGGRYLARISCGECHGTDLAGSPERSIPDLDTVSLYSRPAFFDLLRRGIGAHHRRVPAMMRLSSIRFHILADYEIMALYDYLDARAHAPRALLVREKANALRHRAAIEAQSEE
jgi:mono/diheme cytochrome c family protein